MLSTLVLAQQTFTRNVAKLIVYAFAQGTPVTCGEAFRTPEQQAIYMKTGKSQTANSYHLQRLAIDLNLFVKDEYAWDGKEYRMLAEYWEGLHPNNRAGYKWGWDANHFEMRLEARPK